MLETLRKQGASIVIYAVFGILIAVFVINFGAQSVGTREGCSSGAAETVGSVDGQDISRSTWQWEWNATQGKKAQRTPVAVSRVVQREILAQEAERRGLVVTDGLIDDKLKVGKLYFAAREMDAKAAWFEKSKDGKKSYFSFEALKAFARSRGLSLAAFREQERREMLAAMALDLLRGSARASKEEAQARYVAEHTQVTYDVVAFSPLAYRDALRISDADLDRYVAAHEKDVKDKFTADERTYKGVKPQVHVRQIFIAKATPAKAAAPDKKADDKKADDKKADDKKAEDKAPAAGAPVVAKDDGKDKLVAARAAIIAKKRSFADAAKELDTDEAQRFRGGDMGWLTQESPGMADPKLSDAVRALKPGDVSDVITTGAGSYLLTVEDKREGDLTFDQVKREIAVELAKDAWADEAARRAAIATLDEARAGKKNLGDMFEKKPHERPQGIDPQQLIQLLQDPNTPPELKQQIQQMLQRELQGGDEPAPAPGGGPGSQGRIEIESDDIPAVWGADEPAPATSAGGATPPAPAAAPAAAPTTGTPAAPAAAPAAPAAPAATRDIMKPGSETLPTLGAVEKPKVDRVGPVPRQAVTSRASKDVSAALFDQLADGSLASRIFKVRDGYLVVQLIHRENAELEKFEKTAEQSVEDLVHERGNRLAGGWLRTRCEELRKAEKIKFVRELFDDATDEGKKVAIDFVPCANVDQLP
jgi:parvulin-like peptidyl-prolyl isomerase